MREAIYCKYMRPVECKVMGIITPTIAQAPFRATGNPLPGFPPQLRQGKLSLTEILQRGSLYLEAAAVSERRIFQPERK